MSNWVFAPWPMMRPPELFHANCNASPLGSEAAALNATLSPTQTVLADARSLTPQSLADWLAGWAGKA